MFLLDDELKVEILDIMRGFSICSRPDFGGKKREAWELMLRQHLLNDKELYVRLTQHTDELIAGFANDVVRDLELKEISFDEF